MFLSFLVIINDGLFKLKEKNRFYFFQRGMGGIKHDFGPAGCLETEGCRIVVFDGIRPV